MTQTSKNNPSPSQGMTSHNHHECVSRSLQRAEAVSKNQAVHLTPVRRRTLEILLEGHHAMGAYDLAKRLGAEGLGSQPVVAYRALDFLMAHGLVHKIEGLNAFVACSHGAQDHVPAFLVCDNCHLVQEAESPQRGLGLTTAAQSAGFAVTHTILEAHGTCAACAACAEASA